MIRHVFLFLGVALFLFSCGTSYPLLVRETNHEASSLKEYCSDRTLKNQSTVQGDSLYGLAQVLLKENRESEALFVLERSILYFRIAVLSQEIQANKGKLARLNGLTKKEGKTLNRNKEILEELKEMRGTNEKKKM